jgi:ketosteroid isomerase-like protein
MAGNAQRIIELDAERMRAMTSKDYARLEEVIADELVYTHSSARVDTKRSLLDNMRSGAAVYTGLEASEVKAQDLGDAVVLTGIARIAVELEGKPNQFAVRFTDVYARRDGKWRMVCWQSTRLP